MIDGSQDTRTRCDDTTRNMIQSKFNSYRESVFRYAL